MSTRTSPPAITLRERWLLPARVAWVAVAITALAIILFSIPSSFEHYSSVCTAASEVCSERAVHQATPEGVRALGETGLSLRSYALLNVVVDKVFQLVWFALGALIFWRRSDDWMALLGHDHERGLEVDGTRFAHPEGQHEQHGGPRTRPAPPGRWPCASRPRSGP